MEAAVGPFLSKLEIDPARGRRKVATGTSGADRTLLLDNRRLVGNPGSMDETIEEAAAQDAIHGQETLGLE